MTSHSELLPANPLLPAPTHSRARDAAFPGDRDVPRAPAAAAALGGEDAEAIAKTLRGDREAFEEVVTRHERTVYAMLYRMTGNADDAQELAQETFLRAYRGLRGFDSRRPFRPWILSIAANAAFERARRHRPDALLSLEEQIELAGAIPDERAEHPAHALEHEQRRESLQRAVDTLRGEAAALFHLHYREELGVEEIARSLGKRPNTISVALHRLRERITELVRRGHEPRPTQRTKEETQ